MRLQRRVLRVLLCHRAHGWAAYRRTEGDNAPDWHLFNGKLPVSSSSSCRLTLRTPLKDSASSLRWSYRFRPPPVSACHLCCEPQREGRGGAGCSITGEGLVKIGPISAGYDRWWSSISSTHYLLFIFIIIICRPLLIVFFYIIDVYFFKSIICNIL